jgi:NAD-dependent DNA ligase
MKKIVLFLMVGVSMVFSMTLSQLNKASVKDLMQIKGIGKVKATAIAKYVKKNKIKKFSQLENVKGVNSNLVSNIKNGVKNKGESKDKLKNKSKSKKDSLKNKAKSKKSKMKSKASKMKSKAKSKKENKKKKLEDNKYY